MTRGPDRSPTAVSGRWPATRLALPLTPAASKLQEELVGAVVAAAPLLGLTARTIERAGELTDADVLLAVGAVSVNFDLLIDAARRAPGTRRLVWVGEPILPPGRASGGRLAAIRRSRFLDRVEFPSRFRDASHRIALPGPLAGARGAFRSAKELSRNLHQLEDLAAGGDRVFVTGRDARDALAAWGVAAQAVPFGYEPSVHGEIASPDSQGRDLDIVSLGSADPLTARGRADWLRGAASSAVIVRGVWGSERNAVLRRARVVVNAQRQPGSFIGFRLVLALAAGAVVVGEPMTDPYPFIPGVHLVEAPREALLEEARALVADEPRRRRMALAGQELLAGELSMTRCLARVLDSL
jgi:hypothetical protein